MTVYFAPPDRHDLVLNGGDTLEVNSGGKSNYTTINSGGVENILSGGMSHGTTVAKGGIENVYGRSVETEISTGGVENIYSGGTSVRTHIDGGVEHVFSGGQTQDVFFDRPHSTLELATPTGLTGAIVHWREGDVIDLQNIKLTDLHISAGALTVTYGGKSATYAVVDQQANTFVHAVSDGKGGTDLILTPLIGVHSHGEPGHWDHFA
jgi:autotransporter passenger strand-loop-strand repeat protein